MNTNDLSLITWPNPILSVPCEPVTEFGTDYLKNIISKMFEVMQKNYGIGLAANQIGVSKRIFIADLSMCSKESQKEWGFDKPLCFINPKIIPADKKSTIEEGCLSFPTLLQKIARPDPIIVQAQDVDGKPFEIKASGLFAHVMSHETDHLNGITMMNYMSNLKKDIYKRKVKKFLDKTGF